MSLIVALFLNGLCAQEVGTFSDYETLDGFKTLRISDNICVRLYPATFYGIQIKGPKNLKNIIKWELKNSVLRLYTSQEDILASNVEITVYTQDFEELQLFDNAWVQAAKKITVNHFEIHSTDNGTYEFPLACKSLTLVSDLESEGSLTMEAESVRLTSKGNSQISLKMEVTDVNIDQTDESVVGLSGNAKTLSATLDKNSQLIAWGLQAEDVYLLSANTGDISIYARNRLKINGRGSATINVMGQPTQVDTISINKRTKIYFEQASDLKK